MPDSHPPIRAVFFDIDGTLVSHRTKSVPETTLYALSLLKSAGVKAVIATGRHMQEIDFLPVAGLAFDAYITLNGQLCYDGRKEIFFANPIVDTQEILHYFRAGEVPFMLAQQSGKYISFINDDVRRVMREISSPLPELRSYSGGDIYQAVAFLPEEDEGPLRERVRNVSFTRWNACGIDMGPEGGSKLTGIVKYLEKEGISREETMAFGDGDNDREMLSFAGVGVAMGNAPGFVRRDADYVTADIDEDGVLLALRHFGVV